MLHLLLLFLFTSEFSETFLQPSPPIVEEKQQDRVIEFELVETDPNSKDNEPEAETNLLSDKNSIARDESQLDQGIIPWSEGDTDVKDYQQETPEFVEQEPEPEQAEELKQALKNSDLAGLLKLDEKKTIEDYFKSSQPEQKLTYENLLTSVPNFGGITFNTYNWEYAPYLLSMKRKIQEKINPPYAFTHMGIISGENVIRFIVNKDGTIRSIDVLDAQGHETLITTSRNAIELSGPFLPLPKDFPENYLEVTAKFAYIIRK